MILIFGGTTEGRKAAEVLEQAGKQFFYSTKTGEQELVLSLGVRIDGAMDETAMEQFCREHDIRLLIDAAHPFAERLHTTVVKVALMLRLPLVRYERIFPERDQTVEWVDRVEDIQWGDGPMHILSTLGVQSIARLKSFETADRQFLYRILPRESSIALAHAQGATDVQLCYYREGEDEEAELRRLHPDVLLLKESGISGGFIEKKDAAQALGIRVIAIRRPSFEALLKQVHSAVEDFSPLNVQFVDGPHGLRRMVERFVPAFFPLKSGFTTGTCATAAVKAALLALLGNEEEAVWVHLPDGEKVLVDIDAVEPGCASVIKDFSDDPDVTRGCRIIAKVKLRQISDFSTAFQDSKQEDSMPAQLDSPPALRDSPPALPVREGAVTFANGENCYTEHSAPSLTGRAGGESLSSENESSMGYSSIRFLQGEGVGRVTLPGLGIPVGEPAINPTPRRMIEAEVRALTDADVEITISVENGRELAKRTFNERVGVVDGISIIGTSGIVMPLSNEAFVESIGRELQVARAIGRDSIGLASGKRGEEALLAIEPDLRVVHYGNFIGATLEQAYRLGFQRVVLGIMIGKAVKLAEGHLDTHSHKVLMNKSFLADVAADVGVADAENLLDKVTMARELWALMPAIFFERLSELCHLHCRKAFPQGALEVRIIKEK